MTLLTIGLLLVSSHLILQSTAQDVRYCKTKTCIFEKDKYERSKDPNGDECMDTYQNFCKNYNRTQVMEENGQQSWMEAYILKNETDERILSIIRRASQKSNDQNRKKACSTAKKITDFLKSCLDKEKRKQKGDQSLRDILDNLEVPILKGGKWTDKSRTYQNYNKKLAKAKIPVEVLHTLGVKIDGKDPKKYVLTLEPTKLVLARNYLIEGKSDETVKLFIKNSKLKFKHLYPNLDDTTLQNAMEKVLDLCIELAKASLGSAEVANNPLIQYHATTLGDFKNQYGWNLEEYAREIFESWNVENSALGQDTKLVLTDVGYTNGIKKILGSTRQEEIENLGALQVIRNYESYLTEELLKIHYEFTAEVGLMKYVSTTWAQNCISMAGITKRNPLSYGSSKYFFELFYKKLTGKRIQNKLQEASRLLQQAFIEKVRSSSWMDEKSRNNTEKRAKEITIIFGSDSKILHTEKQVDRVYQSLTIDPDDFFGNWQRFEQFSKKSNLELLPEKVDKYDWRNLPNLMTSEIELNHETGLLLIPAHYFNHRFIDLENDAHPSINMAGLPGWTVAGLVQIMSEFGRYHGVGGSLATPLWTEKTIADYNKKTRCFVDQLNGLPTSFKKPFDYGDRLLERVLIDNMAVDVMRRGLELYLQKHPKEKNIQIKDIPLNPKQMLMAVVTLNNCAQATEEYLQASLDIGYYVSPDDRINLIFKNLKYGPIFGCNQGDPMYPNGDRLCRVFE